MTETLSALNNVWICIYHPDTIHNAIREYRERWHSFIFQFNICGLCCFLWLVCIYCTLLYMMCKGLPCCCSLFFLAHDRMLVVSLCNHDLSVGIGIIVICEHSSWPHAWPNKVHTLHAHAAISCIVAHQKLYHSDLYLLYSSHICMFILMSIVHEVINIATSNLTETRI